ncbi:diguanylate cyclase [Clostridium botulinum]|uniref:sensor domain-containing protein n=1 Tax=Clostridium botulinum TaxID=1491 RepID=UPI0007E0C88F|nr:sensor domain-containing diguanylate cyclase [Clostridium botulinum]KEJ02322.1 diguanylate cyclase [Clostridium botulinum F 357]MBE1305251.1 diguanylate cyclase [Clostridium botulinum]
MKEKNLIKQMELSVIEKMGIAYCCCKISLNSYGQLEDFIFMESNDYFKDLTGFTKEYIKNKKAKDIIAFGSHRINIMKALEKILLYKEEEIEFEDYFDITKKWVKVLLYTQKKQVFYITFYDITKYKVKEIELKNTIKKYKYLIELSADAIIIRNLNGDIIYCNKSALNLFGYSLEEMKNLNMIDLVPRSVMKDIGFNMSIGDKPVERVHKRKDGTHFYGEETTKLINIEGELGIATYIRDITERKIYNDKTKQMAYFDSLTELPNRNSFLKQLEHEIKLSKKKQSLLAIMFLDLDKFKEVNDNFGHCTGDKLLWQVAKRVKNTISSKDLIARFGGDEFTILIRNIAHEKQVEDLARDIIGVFKEPICIEGIYVNIKTSIGISFFPKDGHTSQELIKKADKAMYDAKKRGSNKFQIYKD